MHISFLCAECNEKIIWMQSYSLFLFRFVWHKNLPLYFFCVNSCNNLIFTQNLMVRLRCYRMQGNSVVTWQTVVCTFFLCHRLHVLPHDSKKKSIWLNRQTFHYQFVNWNLWFQQWWWRWWKTRQDGVASHDSNSHKWWILWQLKRIDAIHTIHPINIFTINFIFAYNSHTPTHSLTHTNTSS